MKTFPCLIHVTIAWTALACAPARADAADDPNAAARASLERIETMRKQRPGDGLLTFYEAITRIRLGERDAAFDLLRSLKGRKLGLVPVADMGFGAVWVDPRFQQLRRELADDEPQTPASPVAFRLKDPKLIPEGIAFDEKGGRFLIGSIAQKKIIVTDRQGEARDFSQPGDKLDCVLGLAVDPSGTQLYAVSTNGFSDESKNERRNAVVRYDLESGKLLDRFIAPDAMQLNDLAIAADGTIYVTDSMAGALFLKKPDETKLSRLGTAGALPGSNGIAIGADGALYVALSTGIGRVDRITGELTRLPQPDSVVTGGIDGLYWDRGDLIGVQNVTNPGRVVRLTLADKGSRVSGLTVLQSHHHPDFHEPTTGAIANETLYVLGNASVGHYQPDGTIKDPTELKGTAVIAVPLRH